MCLKRGGVSDDACTQPKRSAHLSGVSSTGIEIDSPLVEAKYVPACCLGARLVVFLVLAQWCSHCGAHTILPLDARVGRLRRKFRRSHFAQHAGTCAASSWEDTCGGGNCGGPRG